jgi:hypothetical protein
MSQVFYLLPFPSTLSSFFWVSLDIFHVLLHPTSTNVLLLLSLHWLVHALRKWTLWHPPHTLIKTTFVYYTSYPSLLWPPTKHVPKRLGIKQSRCVPWVVDLGCVYVGCNPRSSWSVQTKSKP